MTEEMIAYRNAKKQIEMTCAGLDLRCRFHFDEKPLRLVAEPHRGVEGQISLLENLENQGMSPNARLTMTYDGNVRYEFLQQFTISENARKTLVKQFIALCVAWRDLLFWDLHEDGVLELYGLEALENAAMEEGSEA